MSNQLKYYFPIDDWVFVKIYCNKSLQDTILLNSVIPINVSLNDEIEKWFFIRYHDFDSHIRVRYKLKKPKNNKNLIELLKEYLIKEVELQRVWNVQFDSYKPELDRYSFTSIVDTETIFCLNSELYCKSLINLNENERILFNIWSAFSFLNSFYKNEEEIMNFIKDSDLSFKLEFDATKKLKLQLSRKYREVRPTIEKLLNDNKYDGFTSLKSNFSSYNEKLLKLANNLIPFNPDKKNSFVWGHIHMNTNRLFQANQRLYEMITYDSLYRYYNSRLKRKIQ